MIRLLTDQGFWNEWGTAIWAASVFVCFWLGIFLFSFDGYKPIVKWFKGS